MAHDFETLLITEPAPHVLQVTLNRPDSANAFNTQMAREIIRADFRDEPNRFLSQRVDTAISTIAKLFVGKNWGCIIKSVVIRVFRIQTLVASVLPSCHVPLSHNASRVSGAP